MKETYSKRFSRFRDQATRYELSKLAEQGTASAIEYRSFSNCEQVIGYFDDYCQSEPLAYIEVRDGKEGERFTLVLPKEELMASNLDSLQVLERALFDFLVSESRIEVVPDPKPLIDREVIPDGMDFRI